MIRTEPKAGDGKAFDPLASLLYACNPIFKGRGALRVDYHADIISGTWEIDNLYHPCLTPEQSSHVMRLPFFELTFTMITTSGSNDVSVVLYNDLMCAPIAFSDDKGLTNGDFGNLELWYPEAANPGKPRSTIVIDNASYGVTATGGRPYYGVIITKAASNIIEAHGPLFIERQFSYLCTDRSVGSGLQVFCLNNMLEEGASVALAEEEVRPAQHVTDSLTFVFCTPSGETTPVCLTQAALMFDGRMVNFVDYLRAMQMVCLFEKEQDNAQRTICDELLGMSDNIGQVRISVKQVGGRWYLEDQYTELWAKYCSENAWVRSLFSNIKATDDELFLCDVNGHKLGSISKQSDSQSCYALSFAYLMSLATGGSLSNTISALGSAVLPGAGIRTDGNYIVANQNTWGDFPFRDADGNVWNVHKSGRGLAKSSKKRGESYDSQFTLEWLINECGEGGAFILGYDPDVKKEANNRSDHFIVCRLVNGRVVVEFDPYRVEGSTTYARYGADVTNSVDSYHEACVHIFKIKEDVVE